MDQKYLDLFKQNENNKKENLPKINKKEQNSWENINEVDQSWNSNNKNSWKNINEVQDYQQYKTNENINDGWGNIDIQVETRINGVNQNNNQLQPNSRRHKNIGQNLNGLDDFIDNDLREVVKQPKPIKQIMTPPIIENINNVDIVSIEMFEKINTNALLTLANKKVQTLDSSKATNMDTDIKVQFLKS
jgi:hypothetical protein